MLIHGTYPAIFSYFLVLARSLEDIGGDNVTGDVSWAGEEHDDSLSLLVNWSSSLFKSVAKASGGYLRLRILSGTCLFFLLLSTLVHCSSSVSSPATTSPDPDSAFWLPELLSWCALIGVGSWGTLLSQTSAASKCATGDPGVVQVLALCLLLLFFLLGIAVTTPPTCCSRLGQRG